MTDVAFASNDSCDTKALKLAAQSLADLLAECPRNFQWPCLMNVGLDECINSYADCWLAYLREMAGKKE